MPRYMWLYVNKQYLSKKSGDGMDIDDLEPRKGKPQLKNLEPMGLDELREYIARLEDEITRTQIEIDRKEKHRQGLDGLFKA